MKRCQYCAEEIQDAAIACRYCGHDARQLVPSTELPSRPLGDDPTAVISAPQRRTNGLAIASLILGITFLYGVGSILALIFGYKARGHIDNSGERQRGREMATAGIVLGWIGVAGLLVMVVFLLLIPKCC
ncbi:MAG: hypothetical protein QOE83_2704 [Actinomycetota bacterium]|nr:hypothetical protein [Actinomycetota bacterium]